jgi:Na+/H+ antiporter NhaA
MKLVWTILITALIFWAVQILLFGLILANWLTHFFLSLVIWAHLPDSAVQEFIFKILKALMSPVNQFAPAQTSSSSITTFLLIGVDSLIWGVGIGTVIHLTMRLMRKKTA